MKKFFFILVALFTFAFSSSVSAADDDWIYAGRFGLLWTPPVAHNVDMYLINHLTTFRGITSMRDSESQLPYDIYYKHDHSTDTGDNHHEYNNHSFQFQVKIVPLNVHGTTMGSGTYAGTIICSYKIAAKGAFGVVMKSFKIFDTNTDQQLFNAEGNFGSEIMYKDSAAEAILKDSAPHPVSQSTANQLNGTGYYKYR